MIRFSVEVHNGRFHVVGPYLALGDFTGTTIRTHAEGLAEAMNSSDAATAQRGIDLYNAQLASNNGKRTP